MKPVIAILAAVMIAAASSAEKPKSIDNAAAAIAIAEPAMIEKFGKAEIDGERPLHARFVHEEKKDAVWVVEGTLATGPKDVALFGGVVIAVIREADGRVIELTKTL